MEPELNLGNHMAEYEWLLWKKSKYSRVEGNTLSPDDVFEMNRIVDKYVKSTRRRPWN